MWPVLALWIAQLHHADVPAPLPTVEVSAQAQDGDADAPTTATRVRRATLGRAGPGIDIAEVLPRIPGVVANNRWNFAQDTQISIRGYGARASFGVRGVRLYVNGIPATAPDGQGQLSHAALDSADTVEVVRGPLSALYGNASGGVIKVDGRARGAPTGTLANLTWGTDFDRAGVIWRGVGERQALVVDASHLRYDGFRPHSAAARDSLDVLWQRAYEHWTLSATLNALDAPRAQDPLGLTPEQFQLDPDSTTTVAAQFNTRKQTRQNQLGAAIQRVADGASPGVRLAVYAGSREAEQFLAIAPSVQTNPLSSGGVVDLERNFVGAELRAWREFDVGGRPLTLTVGANADRLIEDRRGYENFVGSALGVRGALRRDERNRVSNTDWLGIAEWRVAEQWLLVAGVRGNRVRFDTDDRYVTAENPDDSGARTLRATVPALGVSVRPRADVRLHASIARATETPTVNELAFSDNGAGGLNNSLRAARSTRRELGVRWQPQRGARIEAALFRDDTENDIVVARSSGGRTSFRNLRETRRQGLEASMRWRPAKAWRGMLSWTVLDARARRDLRACGQPQCPIVSVSNRLPAVPARFGFAELLWQPNRDWRLSAEARYADRMFADDTNRVATPGYTVFNFSAARRVDIGQRSMFAFLRVDNIADRRYVGSVIVNEGSGRYFEPAPGRTWMLGLSAYWP
jgi:iron complex outermembrane receptor protein